jgi:phage portal protein BeeE
METPRTNSVVGLSKLETLTMSIDAELDGHAFNARQVRNAAPDGMLHLGKGAKQTNVDSFRAFWQAEQGRGAMAITGGTEAPAFIKFHDSNRDAQFLEWKIYLVRKIAAVMGMDPGDLGIGMDINRSTAEVRDSQTEDRGIRPLLHLLDKHLTREYVWHPAFGGQANNLQFRWTNLNLKQSMAQASIYKIALGGMPYKTVNEARKADGQEPLGPEFDQLAMVTPQGAFSLEDIPSMREFLDMQMAKKQPQVPSGTPPD